MSGMRAGRHYHFVPRLSTRDFGEVEYAADAIIDFPQGLPAFEEQRSFVVLQPPSISPLVILQSAAVPALAFAAVPVRLIDAGYELSILPEDFEAAGCPCSEQISLYALLTLSEDGPPTANLLAPILVNTATRKAVQAIRADSRYSHKHPLGERPCS